MKDCPSQLGSVCKDGSCPVHFPQNRAGFKVLRSRCMLCSAELEAVDPERNGGRAAWFEVGTCRNQCPKQASASHGGYNEHKPGGAREEWRGLDDTPMRIPPKVAPVRGGRAKSDAAKALGF